MVAARRNKRSMNAEIIHRLDRSLYEEGADLMASGKKLQIEIPEGQTSEREWKAALLRRIVKAIEDEPEKDEGEAK